MSADRLDQLLDEAIATGEVPQQATAEERAEVLRLLAAAITLRSASGQIEAEARATMPTARARFERHVAASGRAPRSAATRRGRSGFVGGLFHAHRFLMPLASAAAVGILAVAVLFAAQALFSSTETANALNPGDYVQIQGVVSEASGEGDARKVRVRSEIGDLQVDLSADTAIVADQVSRTPASLKPGDPILVGGVVRKDRSISAHTLALRAPPEGQAQPRLIRFQELRELRPNLAGRVVTLSVSSEGTGGQVVIDAGEGKRFLVRVDGKSAEALLNSTATALGTRVEVGPAPGAGEGVFRLRVAAESPDQRPGFASLKGVVLGREGNILQVEGPRGPVAVVIRPDTRILPGESGLIIEAIREGKGSLVGHGVAVSGGLDRATGRIVADVIVLGPKVSR